MIYHSIHEQLHLFGIGGPDFFSPTDVDTEGGGTHAIMFASLKQALFHNSTSADAE